MREGIDYMKTGKQANIQRMVVLGPLYTVWQVIFTEESDLEAFQAGNSFLRSPPLSSLHLLGSQA